MIKNYEQFYESKSEEKRPIYLSADLIDHLRDLGYNGFAHIFLSLKDKFDSSELLEVYPNYLGVDDKGNITYLDDRYIETFGINYNYFFDKRRRAAKVTKILPMILKKENLPRPVDTENFVNRWKLIFNDVKVVELVGDEILRAYNFKNEVVDAGSCALFPHCGNKDRFDILTKNEQNFSAIVAFDGDLIVGRRIAIKGVQTENKQLGIGDVFKKGHHYKILNNFYGRGGNGSASDQAILKYAKEHDYDCYYQYGLKLFDGSGVNDIFRIKVDNTKQDLPYPSFDNFWVNFKTDEISSIKISDDWMNMYEASYKTYLLRVKNR